MVEAEGRDQEPRTGPDKPYPNRPCPKETSANAALVRIRFQLYRLKIIVLDRACVWPETAITAITPRGK